TAAPPYLYSGPSPVASLATVKEGLRVNAARGDRLRERMYRMTRRVLAALNELGIGTPNTSGYPIIEIPLAKPDDIDEVGAHLFAPLRNRDFRVMWTGMTVSLLGDGIFLVAMAWQVYALSNVPTALSVVGIAMSVPHIAFLLVGGAISDRFDRRLVMLSADGV